MGLRQRLASLAVRRAHALVVEVPGWWTARAAVETALDRRGWQIAVSPADADVLVVCGEPGERLGEAIDRVWEQLPGPRARVPVGATGTTGVGTVLDEAAAQLCDDDRQRADARDRRDPTEDPGGTDHGGTDHGDTDPGEMDHGEMDHGEMDHGEMDHGEMDHGEMAPAGIPLAGGAEDRDGLEMDVLHVPLGPVLPHWPAGLVLRCTLHGDVVAEAAVELLPGRSVPPPPAASARPALAAARACDGAARLLAVAGWDDAAGDARRVRDLVLATGASGEAGAALDRLHARVERSRSLRWLLHGLGVVDDDVARELGLPPDARGDVHDRLLAMLARARAEPAGTRGHGADPRPVLDALPALVTGLDVGAARLVVASLDPDTSQVVRTERAHA